MDVTLNGDAMIVEDGVSVGEMVRALGKDPKGRGVAVAVNGEVVPRGVWFETAVVQGDRIEVLSAAQGG